MHIWASRAMLLFKSCRGGTSAACLQWHRRGSQEMYTERVVDSCEYNHGHNTTIVLEVQITSCCDMPGYRYAC